MARSKAKGRKAKDGGKSRLAAPAGLASIFLDLGLMA
jgi:hypothetical protein